jgi:hypothetical protein
MNSSVAGKPSPKPFLPGKLERLIFSSSVGSGYKRSCHGRHASRPTAGYEPGTGSAAPIPSQNGLGEALPSDMRNPLFGEDMRKSYTLCRLFPQRHAQHLFAG